MKIILLIMAIVFLAVVYLKMCKLVDSVRDLTILLRDISKHIIGDTDDPDSIMLKPSLKELITDGCFKIENQITRVRYGVFGERSPAIDGVNILDTILDIKASIKNEPIIIDKPGCQ